MSNIIKERLELFDISSDDCDRISAVGQILDRHLDEVLARFYDNAAQVPEAAAMFSDPAVVEHARSAQKRHWQLMFSGKFDDAYIQSCERVGRTHLRIKLPFKLYLSSYARAASHLQEKLISSMGRKALIFPGKAAKTITLVNRLLTMDSELVIDAYYREANADDIEKAFTYVNGSIGELAQGNLNCQITHSNSPDFPTQFNGLRQSWNNAVTGLSQTIGTIGETVAKIKATAVTLEEATAGVASRAENQAASLEETNAAISELSDSVTQTAQNSNDMDAETKKAKGEMETGAQAMTNAASAMSRISNASDEIHQITSLIDDISFQTNLLALNAGVEAARAGEAGRGFAVVASEVRNLAASSSNAAQQIKGLINRSSKEVSSGVDLVESANAALTKVLNRFDEVTSLTTTVAKSATDQSSSLVEASTAMADIDRITQQNAAMASDATTQLKDLVKIAENLARQLDDFKLNEGKTPANSAMAA